MQAPTTLGRSDAMSTPGSPPRYEADDSANAGDGPRTEIAAIAGSVRSASWAKALLRATANQLSPGIDLTIWHDLEQVPPFNEDRESEPVSAAVAGLREVVARTDALLIVTPEYNGSFPGILKNALDWASRPYGTSVLQQTPIAVVGTSLYRAAVLRRCLT